MWSREHRELDSCSLHDLLLFPMTMMMLKLHNALTWFVSTMPHKEDPRTDTVNMGSY